MNNHLLHFLLGVFVCLLLVACKTEKVNYESLSPEEVEILYNQGHPELLKLVCEKYNTIFSTTADEQWLIFEGSYRKDIKEKFLSYCKKSSQEGDKKAACYLYEFYKAELWAGNPDFSNFLMYLKKCGEDESIRQFLDNDAIVMAVSEIVKRILSSSNNSDESVVSLIKRFSGIVDSLNECVNDMEKIKGNLVLFSSQESLLLRTIIDMRKNFRIRLSAIKKISQGNGHFNMPDIDVLNRDIQKSINDFIDVYSEIKKQMSSPDKDAMLHIADIMKDFGDNKDKYFKKYHQKLQ